MCTPTFSAAQFARASTWGQPKCPWKEKNDKEDVVLMYNGISLSHEMNEIRPVAATRMEQYRIILSDLSQTEKKTSYYVTYKWILNMDTNELTYKTNRVTDLENTLMATKGEMWGGGRHKPGG